MLAIKNRFHGHNSVRRAYRQGKSVRSSAFSLHVVEGGRIKNTKAAVVVSRKVSKSAVKRNRIRRRIYEIVRLNLSSFKQPVELVITVYNPELSEMPAKELQRMLEEIFKKAKLK